MKLIEAILEHDLRVACGDRWLVINHISDVFEFTIYEHRPYQKGSCRIIDTNSEEEAVRVLTEEVQ